MRSQRSHCSQVYRVGACKAVKQVYADTVSYTVLCKFNVEVIGWRENLAFLVCVLELGVVATGGRA